MVWHMYPAFVNMELQLRRLEGIPRVKNQQQLLSLFGVNNDGKETKELRSAKAATAIAAGKSSATAKPEPPAPKKGKNTKGKKKAVNAESGSEEEEVRSEGGSEQAENVEDGAENEKQAKDDAEKKKVSQKILVANHQEWSETQTLVCGSKQSGRVNTALNFDRSPPHFNVSWKKLSRLTTTRPPGPMRGLSLIEWTSWEWKNVPTQSFNRTMRNLAAASIAESAVIMSYRHQLLLCYPDGGASRIRWKLQDAIKPFMVEKDAGQTRRQPNLTQLSMKNFLPSKSQPEPKLSVFTEGQLPPKDCLTWADGIHLSDLSESYKVHIIEDEMALLEREKTLGEQQRSVQQVVDSLQNIRVAWHDPTKVLPAKEKPVLDADVAVHLRSLVEVSPHLPLLTGRP